MKKIKRPDYTREKKIMKLTMTIWKSLESHYTWLYQDLRNEKNWPFHRDCIKEYAEAIKLLSELL